MMDLLSRSVTERRFLMGLMLRASRTRRFQGDVPGYLYAMVSHRSAGLCRSDRPKIGSRLRHRRSVRRHRRRLWRLLRL